MTRMRITSAIGAAALCLALAGCETAGEKHLRDHFGTYFATDATVARLPEGDPRLAAAKADGEEAEKLAASDAEAAAARIRLHLMGSATRFMRGDLTQARMQAQGAQALCADHRNEAQGPCDTADSFARLFTGVAILENTETLRPRRIESGHQVTAEEWRALAGRAQEYEQAVLSPMSTPRAGAAPDDLALRGEAVRALAFEYCSMDVWETDAAARDAFLQSRPAIVRAHLTGLRKLGQPPASCPADSDGAQCLEDTWAAVLQNYCAG
ncbi:MAG: hypothetical protein GC206_04910 [Alphaproteobacteria bacterium]|nr:hypothetical protein [Alphaproteobacteria bacterium]